MQTWKFNCRQYQGKLKTKVGPPVPEHKRKQSQKSDDACEKCAQMNYFCAQVLSTLQIKTDFGGVTTVKDRPSDKSQGLIYLLTIGRANIENLIIAPYIIPLNGKMAKWRMGNQQAVNHNSWEIGSRHMRKPQEYFCNSLAAQQENESRPSCLWPNEPRKSPRRSWGWWQWQTTW